jgi:hypothetical protein
VSATTTLTSTDVLIDMGLVFVGCIRYFRCEE